MNIKANRVYTCVYIREATSNRRPENEQMGNNEQNNCRQCEVIRFRVCSSFSRLTEATTSERVGDR